METHVTKRDWAVLLGKGTLGAIPVVGPLAAEVLGAITVSYTHLTLPTNREV